MRRDAGRKELQTLLYLLSDRGVAALSLADGTVQWRDDTTMKALFGLGVGGAFVWAADDEDAPGIRYVR